MNGQDKTEEALVVDLERVSFSDLFNLEELQRLQDLFADANEVASLIMHPDGSPITCPSNFTRLCNDIIRTTDKGCANCFKSDASLGRHSPYGPIVQPCLSGGLLDSGASITIGGKHIANWLIGQVRSHALNEEQIFAYADEIGANRDDFT
jgi:ligand-binding sensor protein